MLPFPSLGSIQLATFYKTYSQPNKPAAMISNRLLPLMWTKPGGSHPRKKQSKAEHYDAPGEKGEIPSRTQRERKTETNEMKGPQPPTHTSNFYLNKSNALLSQNLTLSFSPQPLLPQMRLRSGGCISHTPISLSERNKYRKQKKIRKQE